MSNTLNNFVSVAISPELADMKPHRSDTHPLSLAAANLINSPSEADIQAVHSIDQAFAERDQLVMNRDLEAWVKKLPEQGIMQWLAHASATDTSVLARWYHERRQQLQSRLNEDRPQLQAYAMNAFNALKNAGLYSQETVGDIERTQENLPFTAMGSLEARGARAYYYAGDDFIFLDLYEDVDRQNIGYELQTTILHEYAHIAEQPCSRLFSETRAEHSAVAGWQLMNGDYAQSKIVRPSKRTNYSYDTYVNERELSGMLMELGDLDADVLTNSEASYGKHAVRLETLLGTIYSDIMELPTNAYSQLTDYYNQASPRDKKTRLGAVIRHLQHRMDQPAAYETPIDRELAQMAYHYALPV